MRDACRYQQLLAQCSPLRLIDLTDMQRNVPLPAPPAHCPPAFVLGGATDCVVDVTAVLELAKHYSVEAVVLDNCAHDCMLVGDGLGPRPSLMGACWRVMGDGLDPMGACWRVMA